MLKNKKYQNRHLILKTLQDRRQEGEGPNMLDISDIALMFIELVEESQLTESEIVEQIHYLKNENEVIEEEILNDYYYFISPAGTASFYDKKYLNRGKKEFWDNTYDILKNLSTSVLLLIAIITFAGNWSSNNENKSEIEVLKTELKQIKDSIKIKDHSLRKKGNSDFKQK